MFCISHVHTHSVAKPTSLSLCTGSFFVWYKAAWARRWPVTYLRYRSFKWVQIHLHFIFLRGVQEDFTSYLLSHLVLRCLVQWSTLRPHLLFHLSATYFAVTTSFWERSQKCEGRLLPSSCLSICPSAWSSSAHTGRIFMKFGIWLFFENLRRKCNFC